MEIKIGLGRLPRGLIKISVVFENNHGILAAQGAVHHADVVQRRRWCSDTPPRGRVHHSGWIHGVLGPVPGARSDLHPHHQRHVMLPAEHVTRLADLVEDLVGGNPDEVGVHQFDHGGVSAIQGDATGQTGEGGFGNRRAKHPIGEGVLESFRCSARPSIELVDVLAHDHDRVVFLHTAQHHVRDRGDELPLDGLTDEVLLFFELDSLKLGEVAADAVVDGCRVRPQRRNKATCSGSVRVVLHESTRHVGHQGRAPGAQVGDLVVGHDPASHHV